MISLLSSSSKDFDDQLSSLISWETASDEEVNNTVKKIIKEAMISVSSSDYHMFSIPLEVNVNSGYNWGDAH